MNKDILVSIVIASFNAEKYILDLLESAKEQTHPRLELILADDCSKDNTKQLVTDWIEQNGKRFERVVTIFSETNQGTSKNLNGGLRECTGEYIKIIDGDDILYPFAVEVLLDTCIKENYEILIGDVYWVQDDGETYAEHHDNETHMREFYAMSAEEQYKDLLVANSAVISVGEFFKRSFMERFKGFDERYDLLEDYPFWLKVTKAGVKIPFLETKVAKYRQSTTSVKNPEVNTNIYNIRISKGSKRLFYDWRFKGLLKEKKYGVVWKNIRKYLVRDIVIALGNSDSNKLCRILTRFE